MRSLNNPLVSIMMPVYNGEKTIELAIKSLIAQTYTNWLCIIVNDGSTDGTENFLEKYKTDDRFKVLNFSKNVGRGLARQIALDNAEGKYLAYLDADDFYHPEKLEQQVSYLEKNNDIALIACGIASFNRNRKIRSIRGNSKAGHVLTYNKGEKLFISPASAMVKLDLASNIKYSSYLNAAEDNDYLSRYLTNSKYSALSKILYFYLEDDSISYRKFFSYYYYSFIYSMSTLKNINLNSIKLIGSSFIKLLIITFIMPLVGKNYFLNRRGITPTKDQVEDFGKTIKLITDNKN
jgi:glycosyltransferase involved in cell wall biosynthesis